MDEWRTLPAMVLDPPAGLANWLFSRNRLLSLHLPCVGLADMAVEDGLSILVY